VIATRSGHTTNAELVRRLTDLMQADETGGLVRRDSGLDVGEIMKMLPHRYPFLLLDRVIEIEGYQRAVAIKNVTINEPFFGGHFPERPLMPGVLQLEALAQLAGVLLLRKLEYTGKLAVLWSIDKVKLRGAVEPGDQLRLEVETMRMKGQTGQVRGMGSVAGKPVCESVLMFTMVDA
jgi:UDP-3-O-[3-hydroxymyristoyl] N-acetylglucosamine deacetylase/3-hydroxyacyl-[acyl-carrier-protein] dehydratase